MKVFKTFDKATNIITKSIGYIAALALIFNVIIVLANVVLRVGGSSIVGTEEYISMGEVVLIFLALGYTQYTHGLVHVCFFMKKLPKLGPVIAWTIEQYIACAVAALWFIETVKHIPAVKSVTTALLIPHRPFYGVIAVGIAVYFIAQLYEAIKSTIAIFNKDVREDVVENWPA